MEKRSKLTALQREAIARRTEWRSYWQDRWTLSLAWMGTCTVDEDDTTWLCAAARVERFLVGRAWSRPSPTARQRWLPRTIRT